jgi:hypothetical protein
MKELTTEQKLFVLDRLRLGIYTKHNIDGCDFYSEESVLQIIKEFNNLPPQSEISDEDIEKWAERWCIKNGLGDFHGELFEQLIIGAKAMRDGKIKTK